MIFEARDRYNASFTQEKYERFLDDIAKTTGQRTPFRIAETPVFIGEDLKKRILEACEQLSDVIVRDDFKEKTKAAILPEFQVPNESDRSLFIQYDFGITLNENNELVPQLIEVQGFPTLYFYQDLVANKYREHFNVAPEYSHLFNGLTSQTYKDYLRRVIVGSSNPENVILLEVEPDKQPTRVDFICTTQALGIPTLCVSEVRQEGKDLYYERDGRRIGIERIYNRVIFDELLGRKDLMRQFSFKSEHNAEWVGHPSWFYRISKFTLPFFDSPYVPDTSFLHELDEIPKDLENYVLKPLFSFSGSGVIFNVTEKHITSIEQKDQYILQKKISYSPVIQAPEGKVKCEIRMLFVWEDDQPRPVLVNNLARLSRGDLIGVKYNQGKTWVGGSVGLFSI